MGETTAHLPAPPEDVWAVLTKLLRVPDGATRSDGGRTRLAVAEWLPP